MTLSMAQILVSKGDGVTDDTVAIPRALDLLYLNTNKESNTPKGKTYSWVPEHIK